MAKVTEDIIPYSIADGSPCRLRRVNTIGLKRQKISKAQISEIRAVYKRVFNQGGDFASRLIQARKILTIAESPAWNMLEFISMRDKRPICMQKNANDIVTEV
jgi:UDP-N-acetylglucosamine acyltransferase